MVDLLERDQPSKQLSALLQLATTGQGRIVLISGDAGIGKTALVEQFVSQQGSRARGLWGACEALFTPRPLGPLYDLARQMGGRLPELLSGTPERATLFSAVLSELTKSPVPTIVVFEDVHWADEATLDLITFVGRRISHVPVLFLLTYREPEVLPDHPLRWVIGELPSQAVARLPLAPLSRQAVTHLANQAHRSAEQLYAVTGGNPFFVTEVLASDSCGVPLQVCDAVVARLSRLSPAARSLLELLSVIPTRTERWLLSAMARSTEPALEECIARGLLELSHTMIVFRHELARLAVESTLSLLRKQALHHQVLRGLLSREVEAEQAARLVHHARGADEEELVLRYAPLAARHAAAKGAHRQAAEHYRSALVYSEMLTATGQQELHAALLDGLANECALTGQPEEAFLAHSQALSLWRSLDRTAQVGHTLYCLSRHSWRLGQSRESYQYSVEAVKLLETLPASRELGQAYANLSSEYMVASNTKEALIWGRRAIEVARQFQDAETECYALFSIGSTTCCSGEQEGRAVLEQSLHLAREQGFEEIAALSYTNLANNQVRSRAYAKALSYLQDGLAYCAEHDLDALGSSLRVDQARARLDQGDWVGADEDTRAILDSSRLTVLNRIAALVIRSLLVIRRGDPGVLPLLDEAHALATISGEMQNITPVAAARAEWWWLQGQPERCVAEATEGFQAAVSCHRPWYLGEVAIWLWRGGRMPEVPEGEMAQPFAREIAGDWRGAAAQWEQIGCPYEQALALSYGDAEAMREALALLEQLGAGPAAVLVRRRLRELGMAGLPRGPRPSTRTNWAGLTPRQLEVLQLMAEGYSNPEIASQLFTSPRTVEHHVTAILTKLGVRSRAQAIRAATYQELFSPLSSTPKPET